MYRTIFVLALGLIGSLLGTPAVSQERNDTTDLLGRQMKGWSRSGSGKNPWTYTNDGVLACPAIKDSLTCDQELGNGILSLDWRFVPSSAKKGHTASVSVRAGEDELACRINLDETAGTLVTNLITGSDKMRVVTVQAPEGKAKKVGEWNTLKVQMKGKELVISVNGEVVTSTTDCPNAIGTISLNVTGHAIEFRRIHWKEAK